MLSTEDRRVLELYKYYHPNEGRRRSKLRSRVSSNEHSDAGGVVPPDTTLTALCQLAALRLGVLRAGISLLSDQRQYILAESTSNRDLTDSKLAAMVVDGSWGGFVECDRKGGLCDLTVSCPPATPSNPAPCYTILDLRQSHVKDAPFVTGAPFMRFYCGTPITTESGLNIGSLYVIDNRLLPEFDLQQKKLLSAIASLIMGQLEARRETLERQKSIRMGQALTAFVQAHDLQPAEDGSENSVPAETETTQPQRSEDSSTKLQNSKPSAETSSEIDDTLASPPERFEADANLYEDRTDVFARAALLIKDALAVEGCVFFDCSEAILGGVDPSAKIDDPLNSKAPNADPDAPPLFLQRRGSAPDYLAATTPSGTPTVEVLGFSINDQSSMRDDSPDEVLSQLKIRPFEEKSLLRLLKKYPQGMMWSFGDSEVKESGSESSRRRIGGEKIMMTSDERPADPEITLLLSRLPGVRHLLFAPLFDASLGRTNAGCFAFTYQISNTFSAENELSFMRNFMNNMGAELARMDANRLSSSKTDFISSISHELRSPLHGILAAAEFLEETRLSTYQKSLISTQMSCGKTLLHVIEHVLDYSKINSFTRDEQSASTASRPKSSRTMTFGDQMQNLYEKTDIAELVEEVVEGSVAGRNHASADPSLQLMKKNSKENGEPIFGFVKNVAVILDFDYQYNWIYVTQPGAFRRILMNILGNSLKYTAAGCIRVRLKVIDSPEDLASVDSRSTIQLTVSDTGRGISREFLRKRLFTAFQQEDQLSTGCGLGLSIVKSLVDGLGGKLEIKSEQYVGTTVNVKLPLSRVLTDDSNSSLAFSGEWTRFEPPLAEQGMSYFSVGFVGFRDDEITDASARETRIKQTLYDSVAKCMIDWVKMTPLDPPKPIDDADYVVILADERLKDFIQPYTNDIKKKQPRVIALIPSEMTRSNVEDALTANIKAFEIMSAPFGPRKVAKAVAACEVAAKNWAGHMRRHSSDRNVTVADIQEATREGGDILESQSVIAQVENPDEQPRPTEEVMLAEMPQIPTSNSNQVIAPLTTSLEGALPLLPKRRLTLNKSSDDASANNKKNGINDTNYINATKAITLAANRRLLLVDDNQINLRLLETFVRKRKGPPCAYDTAENGLQAVESFKERNEGYAIVFMDLSMPVMDGLEATRRIREIERERHTKSGKARSGGDGRKEGSDEGEKEEKADGEVEKAVVVALTGLANARDQANAFTAGCDLFMTKPARFKEIGRLLDEYFGAE